LQNATGEIVYRLDENFKFEFPTLSPEELSVLLLSQEAIAGVGLTPKDLHTAVMPTHCSKGA
jgi:predicted DNA-binding transcriptional regulator YafY